MNLPNILTIARIFLTFIFLFFVTQPGLQAKALAAAFFGVAALTDFLDGYLARTYNLISDFGKIMDPIADKFLMLSAFWACFDLNLLSGWMFALIAVREVGVTLIRLVAARKGVIMAAEPLGKYKTVFQIGAISLTLIYLLMLESGIIMTKGPLIISVVMHVTVLITILSALPHLKFSHVR